MIAIGGQAFNPAVSSTAIVSIGDTDFQVIYTAGAGGTGTFNISQVGGGSIINADLDQLVRSVTYADNGEAPTAGDRTLTFTVRDSANQTSAGAVATITVQPVNDPDTISLDGAPTVHGVDDASTAATFTEGDAPVAVTGITAYVNDFGENDFYTLALSLSGFADGSAEKLTIGGATFTIGTAGSQTVTAGGTAFDVVYMPGFNLFIIEKVGDTPIPVADLNMLMRGMTYENTSQAPTAGIRQIGFFANEAMSSTTDYAYSRITVVPVNDAPILDLNSAATQADVSRGNAVNFMEGDAAVSVARAVADAYNFGENDITSLKIVASGIEDGAFEAVTIGGELFDLSADSTQTATIGGTTVQIAYVASSGTFTITNSAGASVPMAQADLDALVRGVTYENTDQDPVAGDRTLTFTVTDAGGLTSDPAVATITVVPVNDPPVAAVDAAAPTEDTASISGNVILGAAGGAGEDTDVDGGSLAVTDAVQGASPLTIGQPFIVTGGGTLTLNGDGSYNFAPGTAYNGLDAGETATETIAYTIEDGNGGTATATLVITINGANDTPVVIDPAESGDGGQSDPGPADPLNIIPDVPRNDGEALSPIVVSNYIVDPEDEPLTYTLDPATTPAWVTIDPVTGTITGTPPADASQGTNTGNTGEYLITITATDPDGALVTTTVTLTIVNLAPVAVDDTGSLGEDDTIASGNLLTDATTGDADTLPDSDPLTVSAAVQGTSAITLGEPFTVSGGGTLTLNGDGSYTFAPGTAYNGLDAGETATETITYTVDDGNGGTDTATLVITINGANDTPVVIDPSNPVNIPGDPLYDPENPVGPADPLNIIPDVSRNDGEALTAIMVSNFIVDPDGEPLTYTLDPATTPTWVTIDPVTGTITGTPPADASQGTNTGNTGEYLITITATDPDGALVTTTVTLTIVNLAPVAVDDTGSLGEDDTIASGNVLTDATTGDADKAPDSDPLTVSAAMQGTTPITIGTEATLAGGGKLTLNDDGRYTFKPGTAYNGLDAGETATETITYTVDDGNGGTDTATLIITINGANDTPVVIDPSNPVNIPGDPLYDPANPVGPADPLNIIPDVTRNDGEALAPIVVSNYIVDPDGEPLTYTLDPATAPAWVTIDPATGTITGTPPPSASQSTNTGNPGEYLITITATDPDGAPVATTVTLAIVNLPPAAQNDAGSVSEDGNTIGGNVIGDAMTGDADTAPDSDPLHVAAINGDPALVGRGVTGSTGGTFIVSPDGSWTFDPGLDFQNLNAGESRETTVSYLVSDGQGGFDRATITVTVTGANDAPVSLGPIAPVSGIDGAPIAPIDTATAFANPAGLPLTFSATNLPEGLSIDPATGVISGTLASDASVQGPYTINVTAIAPDGSTSTVAVIINVSNPAPVAVNDNATTPTGTPLTLVPLANDSDPDGDVLVISDVVQPANGTVTVNPDGTLTFLPDAGFTGTETITYTISDGQGGTSTATITVAVGAPPAGAPEIASPLAPATGTDGAPIAPIAIAAGFSDPDGGPLTYCATNLPAGLTIDPATGIVSGNLPANASVDGPYTVIITAVDPEGNQVTQPLVITVLNPAPVAADDGAATPADTPLTLALLANDRDPDGDPLTIASIGPVANGTVTMHANGTLTYTPNAGFTGVETFTYMVTDGQGGYATATVSITVGVPAPGAPVATDTIAPQPAADGTPIAPVDVADIITDPNGDPLAFSVTGLPEGLSIDAATGIISGMPAADASQSGPYTVLVTATDPSGNQITVPIAFAIVNPAPVAAADKAATAEDTPVTIGVLANDNDPDRDPLVVTGTSLPAHGTVVVNPDGTLTYTPDTGYAGTDSFSYTVSDGNGGTTTATVTVNIGPLTGLGAAPAVEPVASTDGETIEPVSVGPIFGDPDATAELTYAIDPEMLPPGLTFDPETGTISGTAALIASQGSTPGEPAGTYIVPITATDENGAMVTQYVTFSFANLAPVAIDDTAGVSEDASIVSGNVITDSVTGDSDAAPDNDPLTVSTAVQGTTPVTIGQPFTVAGGGVLTLNDDGSYTFEPGTAYNGLGAGETATETITYTIDDGNGGTDTATLVITINGANDGPVATPGKAATGYLAAVTLDFLSTASDPDGDPLTVVSAKVPANQGAMVREGNAWVFKPAPGFAGNATITYTVRDPAGLTSTSTYQVNVERPELKAAGGQHESTSKGTLSSTVSKGDVYPVDAVFKVVSGTKNGVLTMKPDGTFKYVPRKGFSGVDRFTYSITDKFGRVVTATETIKVPAQSFLDKCLTTFSNLKKRKA